MEPEVDEVKITPKEMRLAYIASIFFGLIGAIIITLAFTNEGKVDPVPICVGLVMMYLGVMMNNVVVSRQFYIYLRDLIKSKWV